MRGFPGSTRSRAGGKVERVDEAPENVLTQHALKVSFVPRLVFGDFGGQQVGQRRGPTSRLSRLTTGWTCSPREEVTVVFATAGASQLSASRLPIDEWVDPVSRMNGKGPRPLTRTPTIGSLCAPSRNGVEVRESQPSQWVRPQPARRHEHMTPYGAQITPDSWKSTVRNGVVRRRDGA